MTVNVSVGVRSLSRSRSWFSSVAFRKAIWLAPLAFALHEAEEWNIAAFERQHFVDPGYFAAIDHPVLWIGLAQVALQGVVWTALTAWPRNPRVAAFLTLPFFIIIAFGNAMTHVYWQLHFGGYTPGIVTAVFVVAPVVLGLTIRAVRDRLLPCWYAGALYVASVPQLIATIHAGDHLPLWLQAAQRQGIAVASAILGR